MALLRCTSCRGSKNIMGMGMTLQKCKVCDGIGYVKEEPKAAIIIPKEEIKSLDEAVQKIQAAMIDDKQEVKHGRKEAKKEKGS